MVRPALQLHARVEPDVMRRLRLYAALQGITINSLVNDAIDRHVSQKKLDRILQREATRNAEA